MQNFIPGAPRVRGLAGAKLFKNLLYGGRGVPRVDIRRDGAQNLVALAEGLDLKAQLAQQRVVLLPELRFLRAQAQRQGRKERLR